MNHYILCTIDDNKIIAEEIAKLLIQHVWKLRELLTIMIFDKKSQFILLMWNTICKMLKIQIKLSIAFHSKIDEQNEIFNQKIKRYLRAYVNNQQNDWIYYYLWSSIHSTHQFSQLFKSFHFLSITNSNREWVSIFLHQRTTSSENECNVLEKEKLSSSWKKSESLSKTHKKESTQSSYTR